MSTQTTVPAAAQIHALRFAHGATKKLMEGITADNCCKQPSKDTKHALWLIGHFATTDDYFVHKFADQPMALPENWHKVFGMKSEPTADASQYPPLDEVLKAADERRNAFIKWYESLSQAQLDSPSAEGWEKYAPTLGDLAFFLTWHQGYHQGQLSTYRKALGLGPAFG